MIQEQISTSSPKCLNGNAGFGVVAQTSGMAPNVARDVGTLSGYSHLFSAGDVKNPVAFLHVIRRSGGVNRHVLSRVADCGNDYSGRTNRIGHHWIVEEDDIHLLPGGPAAIASQPGIFFTAWNEKPQELPRGKRLPNPQVAAGICQTWQQRFGDAGWGGVVAEQVEKGDPVSIIFEPGTDVLPLLVEMFALLPPLVRWKTTFSTYFMKSQEPPNSPKIQIKCIVVGSDEIAFAKLSPNTLVIDLRRPPHEQPSGKYVEFARTGVFTPPVISKSPAEELNLFLMQEPDAIGSHDTTETYDLAAFQTSVPLVSPSIPVRKHSNPTLKPIHPKTNQWLVVLITVIVGLLVFLIPVIGFVIYSGTNPINLLEPTSSQSLDSQKDEGKKQKKKDDEEKTNTEEVERQKPVKATIDEAKQIANTAKTQADEATKKVNEAEGKVNEAMKAKDIATDDVKQKIQEARDSLEIAENKAGEAITVANDAKRKVNGIKDTAEVEKIADNAEKLANEAKTKVQKVRKTADEAEQKHQEAATKKQTQECLNSLPPVWKIHDANGNETGIALPLTEQKVKGILEKSDFLWKIKDHVKLSIVPFVDLENNTKTFEIKQTPSSGKETFETHEINFSVALKDERALKEQIIQFTLKENGIAYEWDTKTTKKYSDMGYCRKLNRILLSNLRIEIKDFGSKEIALWTPVKYTYKRIEEENDKRIKEKDGYFRKKIGNGEEFVVYPKDNLRLFLDFDKDKNETIQVAQPKTYESSSPQKNLTVHFPKICLENDEKVEYTVSLTLSDKRQDQEDLNIFTDNLFKVDFKKKIDELDKDIKERRESVLEPDKRKEKVQERDTLTDEINHLRNPEDLGNSKEKTENPSNSPDKSDNLEKQTKDKEPEDQKRTKKELEDAIKKLDDAINKSDGNEKIITEKDAVKKKLQNVHIEKFTIDLLKKDTQEKDVEKPENRLRLFEVVPDQRVSDVSP